MPSRLSVRECRSVWCPRRGTGTRCQTRCRDALGKGMCTASRNVMRKAKSRRLRVKTGPSTGAGEGGEPKAAAVAAESAAVAAESGGVDAVDLAEAALPATPERRAEPNPQYKLPRHTAALVPKQRNSDGVGAFISAAFQTPSVDPSAGGSGSTLADVQAHAKLLSTLVGDATAHSILGRGLNLCRLIPRLPRRVQRLPRLDVAVLSFAIVLCPLCSTRCTTGGQTWDADDLRVAFKQLCLRTSAEVVHRGVREAERALLTALGCDGPADLIPDGAGVDRSSGPPVDRSSDSSMNQGAP